MKRFLQIREEVREALDRGAAVLALESSIIAHGMPYPRNIETALAAEAIARELGVVPATVGIIKGKLRIGLEKEEIESLGRPGSGEIIKVSRRDLSYVLSRGLTGATTVCGTMIAAHQAGIAVFATGGIGGVHREAERSFDVSADLLELSQTPLIVVSAGAKAILDLAKTLQFLETRGVPVIGYRTEEFPAFYSRQSGLKLDHHLDSPEQIAALFRAQGECDLTSGILVVNPIPEEAELPRSRIEGYLAKALEELEQREIAGKEVTPFLLARIVELSGGEALEANVALFKNNVRLGGRISLCLCAFKEERTFTV